MSHEAVPHFIEQGGGKIVNISSVAGRLTVPSQMPYGAMKAGSIYFTRTLAVELGKHNIKWSISPISASTCPPSASPQAIAGRVCGIACAT